MIGFTDSAAFDQIFVFLMAVFLEAMKTTDFHFLFFLGMIGLSFSCSDSPQAIVCSDPLGSENITISSSTVDYNTSFFCFKSETVTGIDTCLYNFCFQLSSSPTSQVIRSIYFKNCAYGTIADIGPVPCLGSVTSKPTTGYVYGVTPTVSHGYVASFPDGSYGRFFIDSWTMQSGQIKSLNIVRQYPF